MSGVVFRACDLYRQTLLEKATAYPVIGQKLQAFRSFKAEEPMAGFGANDKPFQGKGNFGTMIRGLKHAHLTHDIMVVYTLSGNNPRIIDLYGIFSHDDLGIGQPANVKKQKSMVKKFVGQEFK